MTFSLVACSSSTAWRNVPYQSLLTDVAVIEYRLTAQRGTPLVFKLAAVQNRTSKQLHVHSVSLPEGADFELVDARAVEASKAMRSAVHRRLATPTEKSPSRLQRQPSWTGDRP